MYTLCFQVAAWSQGFSPEAWDLIEALERRIDGGRAGQASLDALLAALAPEEGCAEWEGEASWKRDPDLKAALAEACPDIFRSARKSSSPALRVDLAAEESVRPAEDGLPGPALAGVLRGSRGGLRLAATSEGMRRRQVHLEAPAWRVQAGQLDFAALPRLPFVSGRRSFPGGGWVAGPEGHLAATSASLDGLAGKVRAGRLQAAAFGAWNRRAPGPDPGEARRDALAHSLAAAWDAGVWQGTWQAAHLRLEVPDREPGAVLLGGVEIRREEPGLRLGVAGSGLRPGRPAQETGSGDVSRGDPPAAGAYAEVAWEERKPGGYLLEAWQATPGWASPLASRPALLRDTAEPGLLLPGRGEGGARLRSELGLLEAGGWALRVLAAATAGWALADAPAVAGGGFLAGEGRASLAFAAGSWTGETTWGSGWRRQGLPASGARLTLGQNVDWQGRQWRAGGSWSRRETASGTASWPAVVEFGRRERGGARWSARLGARDARFPSRDWRLALDQGWPLGSGLRLSHALRLPVAAGDLREDFGYRVKLEFSGR